LNLETGEVESLIKYEHNQQVLIIGGNNIGRVGVLQHVEKHPSGFDIAHLKDATGHTFATRATNVFIIGEGKKPVITLLPQRGIKLGLIEERDLRLKKEEVHSE
jgi:small subunit ribosomal protein S4e